MNIFIRKPFIIALLFITASSCDKNGIENLLTGDIKISDIEPKTEYQAPLIIENDVDEKVILNGEEIIFSQGIFILEDAGFYEMKVGKANPVLFVLLDPERGYPEWGLKKWTPSLPVISDNISDEISIYHPQLYVPGIPIPFLIKAGTPELKNSVYLSVTDSDNKNFLIKKGTGSTQLSLDDNGKAHFNIGTQSYNVSLQKQTKSPIVLNGTISIDTFIEPNSIVQIDKDLIIEKTGSLTITAGCIVLIDEGINITNLGPINFTGVESNPVLITCSQKDKLFGGFISTGQNAKITATHTFFCNFGKHASSAYQYGHANRQALFKSVNTQISVANCYFIDTPGQVFYPDQCTLEIEACVVQRAKTSGQINNSIININNSYFSDFPDDSQVYRDEDNDALYINASDANISNSLFMYAKDDGIDSGAGEGGIINIDNCHFEACFHEGMALSSTDPAEKTHHITNSVFVKCQQGVELGYSSSKHQVLIENCTFANNYIGIRYGDCYEWGVLGTIVVKQSFFENNHKHSWNMVRQLWEPKTENLIID